MQHKRLNLSLNWERMELYCDGLALKMEALFGLSNIFSKMLEKR